MVDPQLHGLSEHLFVAAMVVVVVSSGQQLVMVDQPRHVLSALMKVAAMHEEETQEPPSSSTPPPTLSFQSNKKDISMFVIKKTSRTNLQRFRIKRYLTPRLIIKQCIPKDQRQVCVNVQRIFIPPLLESHFNIIDTTRFRNDLVKKKKVQKNTLTKIKNRKQKKRAKRIYKRRAKPKIYLVILGPIYTINQVHKHTTKQPFPPRRLHSQQSIYNLSYSHLLCWIQRHFPFFHTKLRSKII